MTILGLLDSPSLTGAFEFVVTPGVEMEVAVRASLHARRTVSQLGLAPLTSMFWYGEQQARPDGQFRPEVHDSDRLLMWASSGERLWRPLSNPMFSSEHVRHTVWDTGSSVRGFGLLQRDRLFANYQDTEANYHRRPSFWVTPGPGWLAGRVELVELSTDSEYADNIVAYWKPEAPLEPGSPLRYSYTVRATNAASPGLGDAMQASSWWIEKQVDSRRFLADFVGIDAGDDVETNEAVKAIATIDGRTLDADVFCNPSGGGVRVSFALPPDLAAASSVRVFVQTAQGDASETLVIPTEVLTP